ncbi:hypothetical protein [Pokkaliibacter plantistimulans]|uniref:hypothetical protein n=1 Tax=Pokkaliibacter plantistimulans TaxID=1635171 RepID=UPI0010578E37|nr:hypothetical protein [Pokkaliibacter plantistimulans]
MSSILDIGSEFVAEAKNGDFTALIQLFDARVKGWGKTMAHEEEMTVGLFSDLVYEIPSYCAFDMVDSAVDICMQQTSFDGFNCALDLIASLVIKSNTTEVPEKLRAAFPEILVKSKRFGGEPVDICTLIRGHYRNTL